MKKSTLDRMEQDLKHQGKAHNTLPAYLRLVGCFQRHFGLYSSSGVRACLPVAITALGPRVVKPPAPTIKPPWEALAEALLRRHPLTCPRCCGPAMRVVAVPRRTASASSRPVSVNAS